MAAILFVAKIAFSQGIVYPKNLVLANGGQYGDTTQNVVVQNLHLYSQSLNFADTINTQSIQDILVDGSFAYLAAEDSIYKIDIPTMDIVARADFPAPSTYKLLLNDSILWVGNWYDFGSAPDYLYAFDSDDLSLKFSVPEITQKVSDMALLNDTLIVTQNLTSSAFSDSAGYAVLLDANDGAFLSNIPLDNVADAGWIFVDNGEVTFVNPVSNTYGYFDNNGNYVLTPFGKDISGGSSSKIQLVDDVLLGIFDDQIGAFDFDTETFVAMDLIDSVTSFVFDPIEAVFYVTATDFANYKQGGAYDTLGQKLYDFPVGFSPEALALYYAENLAPTTSDVNDTTEENTAKSITILATDPNNDPLETSILTQAQNGTASINVDQNIEYTPNSGFYGLDSLSYEVCDTELPAYAQLCDQAKVYVWVDQSVGIVQLDAQNTFRIYPNPAQYSTRINVQEAGNYNLRIVALDGRVQSLKENVFIDNNYDLNLQNLAAGQYMVVLENAGKVQVQKLIKK